ncbi:hypothetical protein [Kandleria sp.]|uniref:hypothetical protein n=1 Tax=Kandleria sp. TaxID=2774291 RepID=UPI001B592F00|nr:hypothetical protein [Kandleria sp.]MBP3275937.1 hypothetical protein [Kandleria sp.]
METYKAHMLYQWNNIRCSKMKYLILIPYLLSFIIVGFFVLTKAPFLGVLFTVSRLSYYVAVLFSLSSLLFFYHTSSYHLEEVVETTPRSNKKSFMIFISTLILCWCIMTFIMMSLRLSEQLFIKESFLLLIQTFFFNIVLPIIIFQMIVYLIFHIPYRKVGITIYVLILFLSAPLIYSMRIKMNASLIERVGISIMNSFKLFYFNGQWSPNLQYGLQIEKPRVINLLLFALLCLFLIISIRHKPFKFISLITALTMIIYGTLPYSYYRLDDGALRHDLRDYGYYDQTMDQSIKKQDTRYSISSYKMNIDINRYLKADASMDMHAKEKTNIYYLTLSHDYHVKKIVCKDMKNYKIDKDYIALYLNKKIKNTHIKIIYEGYHPKYYSNEQSIMLPGFFAWYPFAGKQQLFLEYKNIGEGFNIYNKNKSYYELHLNTRCKTITNLDHNYKGYSDSLTLIGGKIVCLNHPLKDKLALEEKEEGMDPYEEKRIYKKLTEIDHYLSSIFDFNLKLSKKKIIIASNDLNRNYCDNNGFIIYDDYILTSNLNISSIDMSDVLNSIFFKNSRSKIFSKIMGYSFDSDEEKYIKEIIRTCREEYENKKYVEAIKQAVNNVGSSYFIKQCAKMLTENASDKEILNKMGVNLNDKD